MQRSLLILIKIFIISITLIIIDDIDIIVSKFFYHEENGFIYNNHYILKFIHQLVPKFMYVYSGILILSLIYLKFKNKNYHKVLYLFITLIVGPGLVVNTILKDNFGRARPNQITEFGGVKNFARAFEISDQCEKNCSFVSGHASVGFYFTAFSFIFNSFQPLIFIIGVFLGIILGAARIIQGGHFVSDVFFSGLIVIFINYIIYKYYLKIRDKG